MKCLIADDTESARELLRYVLEASGVEVIEASDGRQALELALSHTPGFIILDIHMPKMDGYSVVSVLRGMKAFDHVPIVALTAGIADNAPKLLYCFGFTDFLQKPIRPALLREVLQKSAQPQPTSFAGGTS